MQENCPSLSKVRELCESKSRLTCRCGVVVEYRKYQGLIYREVVNGSKEQLIGTKVLVVPEKCRSVVLRLAHDIPSAGHFSHRKTYAKCIENFWWPRILADVTKYCKSCDICQRTTCKGRVKNVPLEKMPIIGTPFQRVAIDLVGPLVPMSSEEHQYVLTLVDYASSYPEAIPMTGITSTEVAEALVGIFSRIGIPREIISDQGPQFKSELMSHFHTLLGVKPIFCTRYHPAANGRVERQHSILKDILRKLCQLKPREWHRFLPSYPGGQGPDFV